MIVLGKIVGILIGFPFGIFGILFGVLAGSLVDQVLGIRRNSKDVLRLYIEGEYVPRLKRFARPAAAIALCFKLMLLDHAYDDDKKQEILRRIREFFHIGSMDERRLNEFWQLAAEHETELQLEWLVRLYAASNPEHLELSRIYSYSGETARDFLFNTMHWIARSDRLGLSRGEYRFLLDCFTPMGLAQREVRERLCAIPGLNSECLQIMELSGDCSEHDVKKRYRELAAQLHPDSSIGIGYGEVKSDEENEKERRETFSRLQNAYEKLLWQFRINEE